MFSFIVGLCVGWVLGAGLMWLHFVRAKLIRSREEWERARNK